MSLQTSAADLGSSLLIVYFVVDAVYGLTLEEWTNIGLMCGPSTIHKLCDLLHVDILTRWYIGNRVYTRMFNL